MRNLFALFILLHFFIPSTAQDTVYFKKNTQTTSKKNNKGSTEKNIVKLSPLSFLWGQVPVSYEREINSFFSVEVGVGITTQNFLRGWAKGIREDNDFNDGDIIWNAPGNENTENILDPYQYKKRKAQIGYFITAQPRIYIESEGMDGSYIGFSVSYLHFGNKHEKLIPNSSLSNDMKFSNESVKEHEKFTDFMVNFGSQSLFDRISLDYSVGLGLRNINSKYYAVGMDFVNDNYIDGYITNKKTQFAFNLSIKVGYHF